MASETYVLRSGSPHRSPETGRSSPIDPAPAIIPNNNPWALPSSVSIADPDEAEAPGQQDEPLPTLRTGPKHSEAVDIARQYRGVPYVWGGTTSRGFDCSGFVRYVYARLGNSLPRTASEQFHCGKKIKYASLLPGDVLFFHTSRPGVSHVGIYVGNNKFIHAANPKKGVTINSLTGYYAHRLVGARRLP